MKSKLHNAGEAAIMAATAPRVRTMSQPVKRKKKEIYDQVYTPRAQLKEAIRLLRLADPNPDQTNSQCAKWIKDRDTLIMNFGQG